MQKTITVNGHRYTGRKIAWLFDSSKMTNGDDYIVTLGGNRYFANYRQIQDQYYAPVCDAANANAISLCKDDGSFEWSVWLSLKG